MPDTIAHRRIDPAVRAHVVLRRLDGSGAEPNRRIQTLPKAFRDRVMEALAGAGFKIRRSSPLSILVEGSPSQFGKVFQALPQRQKPTAKRGLSGDYWIWNEAPKIPDWLSAEVDDVVLPEPPALH